MNKMKWVKIVFALIFIAISAVGLFIKVISDVVFAGILVTLSGFISKWSYQIKKGNGK